MTRGGPRRDPHLRCRDVPRGPGGGGVAGRCWMPTRTGAERTRELPVLCQRGWSLRLSYAYGIITVSIMPQTRASMSGTRRLEQSAILERHTQRFGELKRDLEQLEHFCKGTVLKRMMKCGKAHCACASDPAKRHGPYYEITYKANGKTVNVKLSPEAAPLYKAASQQYRKLKTLLKRLEKLSQTILRYRAKLIQSRHRD